MRFVSTAILPVVALLASPVWAQATDPLAARRSDSVPSVRDTQQNTADLLDGAARKRRIPTVLLRGLAWHLSQWDRSHERDGRVGVLAVPVEGRTPDDVKRLQTDATYNIAEGARLLELCWNRAPIIGNGHLDDGRNILECWYFALGRYGTTPLSARRNTPNANPFAESVLNTLADSRASGQGTRWETVWINRPSKAQLARGLNLYAALTPWHLGDVAPRPRPRPVVSLDVPYLSQVWDSPDGFDGGGACGPTSLLMVLAYYNKIQPTPVEVRDSYVHTSRYGGLIPFVQEVVCDPNLGAVHAKMLRYLRPQFPDVAIYYDKKATYARVKKELDAGRPVILGTEVTPAGHIMVARGYLADGRLIVNDPAGDRDQAARAGGPQAGYSVTGVRYWNGDGGRALYDWDALATRWVMTFGPKDGDADRAEDE